MDVFAHPEFDNHEQLVFGYDPETNLRALIAIHDTTLGPALGGCRMWPYASEAEAVTDALRLSRGMTRKSAVAGLELGGGKAVIMGDPARQKTPELMRAMGRVIDRLGGAYVTAEDSGMSVADLRTLSQTTHHVVGINDYRRSDGSAHDGDPSPATADGVYRGIRAAVRTRLGRAELRGVRVAIQGTGAVGARLARHLAGDGAELTVADINPQSARDLAAEVDANVASPDAIVGVETDVLSPCALGATINRNSRDQLRCSIVAGAANNQLATDDDGIALWRAGILYAPDFVINAGGIIDVGSQYYGYDPYDVDRRIAGIETTLTTIFERAYRDDTRPEAIAVKLADERIAAARH
jgi:leucine dehydrogenase